jgi:hypothetical protein
MSEVGSTSPNTSFDRAEKQKKKVLPPPTAVPPGTLPDDLSVWDNAVLLIDKPKGWTSFDVCGKLRGSMGGLLRRQNRKIKVGHAGTLDPMATGLLVHIFAEGARKEYNLEGLWGGKNNVTRVATPQRNIQTLHTIQASS